VAGGWTASRLVPSPRKRPYARKGISRLCFAMRADYRLSYRVPGYLALFRGLQRPCPFKGHDFSAVWICAVNAAAAAVRRLQFCFHRCRWADFGHDFGARASHRRRGMTGPLNRFAIFRAPGRKVHASIYGALLRWSSLRAPVQPCAARVRLTYPSSCCLPLARLWQYGSREDSGLLGTASRGAGRR
jgi:hypothetical protein